MSLLSRFRTYLRIKASALLDRSEDPRQTLDYAYAQQQELLRRVREGVIEVVTSKRLLERQAEKLEARGPQSERQATQALAAGREDLARLALQRKHAALVELGGLRTQVAEAASEERRLILAEQQLAASVEEFRTRRITLQARYTAAEAQTRTIEALTGVSQEFADLGMALGRAEERIERMQARAVAIDTLIESGSLEWQGPALDRVEDELRRLSVNEAVEREIEALKAGTQSDQPLALPAQARAAGNEHPRRQAGD